MSGALEVLISITLAVSSFDMNYTIVSEVPLPTVESSSMPDVGIRRSRSPCRRGTGTLMRE